MVAHCAPGSNTVCDFFANVSPSFQPDKRLVSLGPTFKTELGRDGDSATVYFECHYFDADSWHAVSHLSTDATAKNVDGRWLFAHGDVSAVGVPYPKPDVPRTEARRALRFVDRFGERSMFGNTRVGDLPATHRQ